MIANPYVGLNFYWPNVSRQINIDAEVVKLSSEDSDRYWSYRTRDSQVAGWASNQQEHLTDSSDMKQEANSVRQRYPDNRIPRPENWSAFRIEPFRVEFWDSGWRRMKARKRYFLEDGQWKLRDYQP